MTLRLTPEFLKANHVYFRPRTEEEAVYVMQRLFDMGVRWSDDGSGIRNLSKILETGMNVDNGGRLYPGEDNNKPYVTASAKDFTGFVPERFLPAAERAEKRIQALEKKVDRVEKKIDRLLELFEPRVIAKPAAPTMGGAIRKVRMQP